jgi:hypothetical protein
VPAAGPALPETGTVTPASTSSVRGAAWKSASSPKWLAGALVMSVNVFLVSGSASYP